MLAISLDSAPGRLRIRRVLLAGNPYDAFLLEEAGFRTPDQESDEDIPTFHMAPSGRLALKQVEEGSFDMVLADHVLPDMSGLDLAVKLRQGRPDLPVVVITSNTDLGGAPGEGGGQTETGIFIWYGAPSLLRTLVKLQEDELNAPLLVGERSALVILLVEDEPNFYSHFLPLVYERIRQSAIELIPVEQRPASPWAIIESRPLVLLRRDFEGACEVLYRYRTQVLALVTDMRFPVQGQLRGDAGLRLIYRARSVNAHLPVAVHSRDKDHRRAVAEAQAKFLSKDSPRLLAELDHFLINYCGFGPFVFRWPAGGRYGVARNLHELVDRIETVPDVVFEHHALHFDFSSWLAVHGYQELARKVRALRVTATDPRKDVLDLLREELDRTE